MLSFATDGLYFPRTGSGTPASGIPPGCPLPPIAEAILPESVVAMELAPLDPEAETLTPQAPTATTANYTSSSSAEELKPLSPTAIRTDEC